MSSVKTVPLIPTVVVITLAVVMINLGFWQLRRFDEKIQWQAEFDQRAALPPKAIEKLTTNETTMFQRVVLRGHFQSSPQWLIANQFQNGKLGFYVLSVFVLENQQRVIVNRGFIAGTSDPNQLPDIALPEMSLHLNGHLYWPSKPWRSPPLPMQQAGVNVLPVLDWVLLRDSLARDQLFPYLVRLDADAPHGFARDWPVVAGMPQKHRAYAVQWFAMALALLALYGLFLNKRVKTLTKKASTA